VEKLIALSLDHRWVVALLAVLLILGGVQAAQTLPIDAPPFDRSELVPEASGTVSRTLLQGAGLVVLVLLVFMGHWRSAVLVALQLLLAVLATLLVMSRFGLSAALMSLSGLAIAIGLLGDGAIVLVENAVRLLGDRRSWQQDRKAVLLQSAHEVVRPVVFGVAATLVALLPIATLRGLDDGSLAPMARTMVLALTCALLLSVTLIPALAFWLLKPAPIFGGGRIPHPADFVRRMYRPQLAWALAHPRAVGVAVLALLGAAAALAPTLGDSHSVAQGGGLEQQRAVARLALTAPVALLLVFALLYLGFRALRPVLLILVGIPLALVGGVFGLKVSGMHLSVSATAGFTALFGIAVFNSLVMLELFRDLEAEGRSRDEAVRVGAELRLRPVLMTAATTALGLLPLLWATGEGVEAHRPLAVVVASGVVTSTLLTLMVLPVLYRSLGGDAGQLDRAEPSPDAQAAASSASPSDFAPP